MTVQVNVRLPEELLNTAQTFAKTHGFGNIQELIRESLREKVFVATANTEGILTMLASENVLKKDWDNVKDEQWNTI